MVGRQSWKTWCDQIKRGGPPETESDGSRGLRAPQVALVIIPGFSAVTAAMWAHAIGGIVVAVLAEGSIWFSAFVQCEQARVSEPVLFCPVPGGDIQE
ncbi:SPW repeat protein [Rhizobium mulingense]|uniref:SPW repeat protein n=1 Tax=Rhizobium mulingense TaxID=3031128 RepID=UPI002B49A642|nr:SPW repeat protein [Rhizobium sp. MJ21]